MVYGIQHELCHACPCFAIRYSELHFIIWNLLFQKKDQQWLEKSRNVNVVDNTVLDQVSDTQ